MEYKKEQIPPESALLPEINLITNDELDLLIYDKKFPASVQKLFDKEKAFSTAPPQYRVQHGGKTIYLSEIYCYDRQNYPLIFAYIQNDNTKELVPQLFYYSNSRAQWRVAPGFAGNSFSKGNLGFTCDISPPLNIALIIHSEAALTSEDYLLNKIGDGFVRPFSNAASDLYLKQTNKSNMLFFKIRNMTEGIPDFVVAQHEIEEGLKSAYKKGLLPDLSKKIIEIPVNNSFYTQIFCPNSKSTKEDPNFSIFICPSANNEYLFMFASVKNTKKEFVASNRITFLLTASKKSLPINDFCIPIETVELGYFPCYPIMHSRDEMITNYLKNQNAEINYAFVEEQAPTEDYMHFEVVAQFLPLNQVEAIQQLYLTPTTELQMTAVNPEMFFTHKARKLNSEEEKILIQKVIKISEDLASCFATNIEILEKKTTNKGSLTYKKFKTQLEVVTDAQEKLKMLLENAKEFEGNEKKDASLIVGQIASFFTTTMQEQSKFLPEDIKTALEKGTAQLEDLAKGPTYDY